MEYRRVGESGLKVSELAYGSWMTVANQIELDNVKAIIKRGFELGINYFDTADVYECGAAEELLGKILPEYNRSAYIIATKCFFQMTDNETDKGLSRKHIIDSINGSLKRLNLDYIDLFYCHRYDEETPLEETLKAMNDIVVQGLTTYWGVSEWPADKIEEACAICEQKGWIAPIVNQPIYNLINRDIEVDVVAACDKNGLGIANYSPLAQGVLTGKYSGGVIPEGSRASNNSANIYMGDECRNIELLERVDMLGEIAAKYDLKIAQLALAWVLQNPTVCCVINGASSVKQIEDNVKASGVVLEKEDMDAIEKLFPGPK